MLHATFLQYLKPMKRGLIPHGAPVPAGRTPRQDLYLGLGSDPRGQFPNPRKHPCSKLTDGRNVMLWINWGAVGRPGKQSLMRVTGTGAILTRSSVPRQCIYLGVMFAPDTLAVVVVAASRQALEARDDITAALTQWGAVTWPEDPAEYWTHEGEDVDEPFVGSVPHDALLGTEWPSPLTGEDAGLPAGEDSAGEASPDWAVDIESSDSTEEDEEDPSVLVPALSVPDEEGDPPVEEADPQKSGPLAETGGVEEEEEEVLETLSAEDRVAQALARRPDESGKAPPLPPWRDGSRPPHGAPQSKGGSRRRANPPNPRGSPPPRAPTPKGHTDAQRARMGLSFSSAAGAPVTRAQLEEAIRAADAARVQAEAAQAAARAQLVSFESATPPEPAPTRGQAAVERLETKARSLSPGGTVARDRSHSARAVQQTDRVKPQLTARAKTPSAVPAPPWAPTVPGPTPGIAPPSAPKVQHPLDKARLPPIGAPPPAPTAQAVDYELVGDESPAAAPKAELRPARPQQAPIGAPPPHAPDLELDDDAVGVGTTYPSRGWRIPRDPQGEIALDEVRPDIDNTAEDLANGYTEVEALRRLRDRVRAARHNAKKWHTWQVDHARGRRPVARRGRGTSALQGPRPCQSQGPRRQGGPPRPEPNAGESQGFGRQGARSRGPARGQGRQEGRPPGSW